MALADSNNDNVYSEDELNALTKTQLLVLADELGVEGLTTKNLKAEIVAAILAN